MRSFGPVNESIVFLLWKTSCAVTEPSLTTAAVTTQTINAKTTITPLRPADDNMTFPPKIGRRGETHFALSSGRTDFQKSNTKPLAGQSVLAASFLERKKRRSEDRQSCISKYLAIYGSAVKSRPATLSLTVTSRGWNVWPLPATLTTYSRPTATSAKL